MRDVLNYEETKIRTIESGGKTWYSVVDIVAILTDSVKPRKYWNTLKCRLEQNRNQIVTYCEKFKLKATDGKMYSTDCLDKSGVLRLIQTIRKPNAKVLQQLKTQGFEIEERKYLKILRKEERFKLNLETCLQGITLVLSQFPYLNYYIDFYLPEINLAIEYDEYHHTSKATKRLDELRQREISNHLGCDFIRVRAGKEDIGINRILKKIISN